MTGRLLAPLMPSLRNTSGYKQRNNNKALIAQLGERQTEAIRSYPLSGVI